MSFVVVVVAVVVPVVETRHHPRNTHEHHSVATIVTATVALSAVALLLLVAAGFGVRYLVRHRDSTFAAPIVAGLPRRQRRAVGRNVRRGTPSDDPLMASVERETALRTVSQARYSMMVLGWLFIATAFDAVVQHGGARVFFGVFDVFLIALALGYWLDSLPKARRYLEAAEKRRLEGSNS